MNSSIKIVLADDNLDNQLVFKKALMELSANAKLVSIENGEKLMKYLTTSKPLPDAIFLDLNMTCKNGLECLEEIKSNEKLKEIPIIVYSTSFHSDILDLLHSYGAFYCIRKTLDCKQTKKNLKTTLKTILENKHVQPTRKKFALGLSE